MSIFDRVLERVGYVKASNYINAPEMLRASAGQDRWSLWNDNQPDPAKFANLYSNLSWLQSAIDIPAQMAAGQALEVYSRKGEETEEIENHPFEMLLDKPNPLMPRHEFLSATVAFRQIAGNAYWWVNAPSPQSPPSELWIIPPDKLTPVPDGYQYLAGYLYEDGSYKKLIPVEEIVHFKRFNPTNMFVGLSAVQALTISATGDLAMQRWNTNLFGKNNAKPEGLLAMGNNIPDGDWERLKEDMRKEHGGTTRNLLMMRNLPKEMVSWLQMGISQREMEFIGGRTFTKEEIYNAVAPGLASVLSVNATEANAIAGEATLTAKAIWPILTMLADTITSRLLVRYGDNLVAKFEDPRRQDKALELQTRQVQMKYMTIEELRAEDGLEPLGDDRDSLLPIEVEHGAGVLDKPEPPEQVIVSAPAQPPTMPPNGKEPEEPPMPEDSMMANKAWTTDARLWRKKALRAYAQKGTGVCAFDSAAIPIEVRNRIAYGLAMADNTGAIKAAFDGEIKAIEGEYASEVIELAGAIRHASGLLQGMA